MKRWLLTVVMLGALGQMALAAPRLVLDRDLYDFGSAMDGTVIRFEVTLTNAGDAQLNISRVAYNCSCTSYHLPKRELAPGESVKMTITFNTTGYSRYRQPVSQVLTIYSNDPQKPEQTIIVRGNVRSLASYEAPAATLDREFYLLVDLRTPEAYARGHLLGSINIPFAELGQWLARLPKSKILYLYDETGAQAVQAAQILQQNGFLISRAISGGLAGWWQAFGDLFFVWAPDADRTPPGGSPYFGPYSVYPTRVAESFLYIVDVRAPEAYANGHLAGAANVPLTTQDELAAWAASLPKPRPGTELSIWIVDDDGTKACTIAQYLQTQGFTKARCLFGGLASWRAQYGDELVWPKG
ncbi:MAG: rhodanese-like domain-containing protein [Candidatus Acetothermia bacterium]|jgi:rhodanese-related sulfurtransferase|nr:rhodanese-like domain-containing protein [Candidatus Acetothermia bacterium]